MTPGRLTRESLFYHWRTHLAVVLGVVTAASALTGALVVGDSMRASLRQAALDRLGRVDAVLVAPRLFRAELAKDVAGDAPAAPMLLLRGGATHAASSARAEGVNVFGIDDRFWTLAESDALRSRTGPTGRSVVLNERLAEQLGASAGDDVLIRVGKPSAISTETLLGRRDDTTVTLRLTVESIVPSRDVSGLSLQPQHRAPLNAFVAIEQLQQAIGREGRASAIAAAGTTAGELQKNVQRQLTLDDLGLELRMDDQRNYIAVESEGFLTSPPMETAILSAAQGIGAEATPISAYLANSIERESAASIPYSTVVAVDPVKVALTQGDESRVQVIAPGTILLNQWAADDLGARPGTEIEVTYYVTSDFGELDTRSARFTVAGVVRMDETAIDPGFTPEYPGVTDTVRISDWDPPFPMNLGKVRDKDEEYWDRYRTAPKAFLSLEDGLKLWAGHSDRHGRYTSIRFFAAERLSLAETAAAFEQKLLDSLDPEWVGWRFIALRQQAHAAATGTTDFGMLFIGFSFFLIASAALLVALLFRLTVERRGRSIGMMLATGFSPRRVSGLLVAEGAVLAAIGSAIGLAGAIGYAWLMLAGLRSWWSSAVNAPFLTLSATPQSLVVGWFASFAVAVISIAWSVRGLTRLAPAALLAGAVQSGSAAGAVQRRRISSAVAMAGIVVAAGLALWGARLSGMAQAGAFFGSGSAMLAAAVAAIAWLFSVPSRRIIGESVRGAATRLGVRNAPRHASRSLLAIGLIGAATFVIAALEAFRLEADTGSGKQSGDGGFSLLAESAAGLPFNPNTVDGRDSLNFTQPSDPVFDGLEIIPFRLRAGDEASCLNLYVPSEPRIVGAPPRMVERGGFQFAATLAEIDAQRANPWHLLDAPLDDGAIPAIADESAVLWQFHLGLGRDFVMRDERGRKVRLRFVALLKNSVLQDEIVVGERDFTRMFPSIDGHAFFLIDAPPDRAAKVATVLEEQLARYAFDAEPTARRLADYLAVQNTYLSTFQTLGGLGLVLGTIGVAAVLLRNVWERRGELALMQALGFSRRRISWVVLAENLLLIAAGLATGALAAAVAIAPHVITRPDSIPWVSLSVTLISVLAAGSAAAAIAVWTAVRGPLVAGLRHE